MSSDPTKVARALLRPWSAVIKLASLPIALILLDRFVDDATTVGEPTKWQMK